MKRIFSRITLIKFLKLLKWGKMTAKIAAIGTTLAGAVTAFSSSATAGAALSAAGATAYAATRGMPVNYEKTRHIPPGRADKIINSLRQRKMDSSVRKGREGALSKGQACSRIAAHTGIAQPTYTVRKK